MRSKLCAGVGVVVGRLSKRWFCRDQLPRVGRPEVENCIVVNGDVKVGVIEVDGGAACRAVVRVRRGVAHQNVELTDAPVIQIGQGAAGGVVPIEIPDVDRAQVIHSAQVGDDPDPAGCGRRRLSPVARGDPIFAVSAGGFANTTNSVLIVEIRLGGIHAEGIRQVGGRPLTAEGVRLLPCDRHDRWPRWPRGRGWRSLMQRCALI